MSKLKSIILTVLISAGFPFLAPAVGVGSGISVYIPESLYEYNDGSISLEQNLEVSLGLSSIFSLPLGINYNTNYGLMVDGEDRAEDPWFYSDALMPYALLKAHIPLGAAFIELFGGVGANRNLTLRSLEGNIEKNLSSSSSQAVFKDGSLDYENNWGFGYLAGGAVGIMIDQISLQISALYRDIRHELNLTAEYASSSEITPGAVYDPGESLTLVMRGISVGIGGSFSF